MTFGQRINSLRKARQWTLSELARQSDLSRSYIYQLEDDDSSPTLQSIEILAAAFEMTALALLEPLYAPMAAEPPFPLTERVPA